MDSKTDTFFAHSNKTDCQEYNFFFLMTVGLNYGIKKDNDNLKDFVDSRGNQVHTSHKCSQLAN